MSNAKAKELSSRGSEVSSGFRNAKALPPLADNADLSSIEFFKTHATATAPLKFKEHTRSISSDDFVQLPTTDDSVKESVLRTTKGEWKQTGGHRGKDSKAVAGSHAETDFVPISAVPNTVDAFDIQASKISKKSQQRSNQQSSSRFIDPSLRGTGTNIRSNSGNNDMGIAAESAEGALKADGNAKIVSTGRFPKSVSSLKPLIAIDASTTSEKSEKSNLSEKSAAGSSKQAMVVQSGSAPKLRPRIDRIEPGSLTATRENSCEVENLPISRQLSKDGVYTDIMCTNLDDLPVMEPGSGEPPRGTGVVINNTMKANANDQILQEKIMEGKALNRRDEDGAVMHKFSLWSKVKAPVEDVEAAPISTEATGAAGAAVQSAAYLSSLFADTYSDRIEDNHKHADITSKNAKHVAKSPVRESTGKRKSKLRGPREALASQHTRISSPSPTAVDMKMSKSPTNESKRRSDDVSQVPSGPKSGAGEKEHRRGKGEGNKEKVQGLSISEAADSLEDSQDQIETPRMHSFGNRSDSYEAKLKSANDLKGEESDYTNYVNDEFEVSSDCDDDDDAGCVAPSSQRNSANATLVAINQKSSQPSSESSLASSLRTKVGGAYRLHNQTGNAVQIDAIVKTIGEDEIDGNGDGRKAFPRLVSAKSANSRGSRSSAEDIDEDCVTCRGSLQDDDVDTIYSLIDSVYSADEEESSRPFPAAHTGSMRPSRRDRAASCPAAVEEDRSRTILPAEPFRVSVGPRAVVKRLKSDSNRQKIEKNYTHTRGEGDRKTHPKSKNAKHANSQRRARTQSKLMRVDEGSSMPKAELDGKDSRVSEEKEYRSQKIQNNRLRRVSESERAKERREKIDGDNAATHAAVAAVIQSTLDEARKWSADSNLSLASDFEMEVSPEKVIDIDKQFQSSMSFAETPAKYTLNTRPRGSDVRRRSDCDNGGRSGALSGHDATRYEENAEIITAGKKDEPILRWKRGQAIGEGSFGKVFKGLNERTGELMAVKQLFLADGSDSEVDELRKEITLICDLDHDNIVRYLGTAQSDRYLFIFLEYIPGGSIASMLEQFGAFPEDLVRRFCSQVVAGMAYLHSKGIIHRDIKGSNTLVTDSGVAKLSDFGCSKKLAGMCTASLEESLFTIKGSVPWMAPEVIKQSGHGRSSDVWSLGAMIIEMATAKPPWPDFTNNLAALFHVATSTSPPPFPEVLSSEGKAFLGRCLVIDPKHRAAAADLLTDPFLPLSEATGGSVGGIVSNDMKPSNESKK